MLGGEVLECVPHGQSGRVTSSYEQGKYGLYLS